MSRTLPHSLSAERAILGSLLVHPKALERIAGSVRPEDCYVPAHQEIFKAALDLAEHGQPVDPLLVEAHLDANGQLARVGGLEALMGLVEHASLVDALPHHARIVRDRASLRRLILSADEISSRAASGVEDVDALIRDATSMVRDCYRAELKSATGSELLADYAKACDWRWHHPEESKPLGVPTGFPKLDEFMVFSGLPRSHVTIVAADTSKGKSALAQAFMRNACKAGFTVLDITLEDKQSARMVRHISAESGLQNKQLQNHVVLSEQWPAFTSTCVEVGQWASRMLFLDRKVSLGMPIDDLLSAAHRMVDEHAIDLVTFDYLQLIDSGKQLRSRQEHVDYAVGAIERWAGMHPSTATILISQLKRRDEQTRPNLRDLYHSAKLEQAAHTVLLIWAPKPRGNWNYNCRAVDVAKQKDGPTGLQVLGWEGKTVRWFPADPIDADKYVDAIGGAA